MTLVVVFAVAIVAALGVGFVIGTVHATRQETVDEDHARLLEDLGAACSRAWTPEERRRAARGRAEYP